MISNHVIIPCNMCVFWLPLKEDSTAADYGICPIKKYPANKTEYDFMCDMSIGMTADKHNSLFVR